MIVNGELQHTQCPRWTMVAWQSCTMLVGAAAHDFLPFETWVFKAKEQQSGEF